MEVSKLKETSSHSLCSASFGSESRDERKDFVDTMSDKEKLCKDIQCDHSLKSMVKHYPFSSNQLFRFAEHEEQKSKPSAILSQ